MKKIAIVLFLISLHLNGQCWKVISATDGQTFCIRDDNTLWACGVNDFGELGDGTTQTRCELVQIGSESNWKSICGGYAHNIALKLDGTLWACGYNGYGQLGDGTTIDKHMFIQIGVENDWKEIISGDNFNLAIKNDGSLWAWGKNDRGQLGDGTLVNKLVPTQIGFQTDWKHIGAGFYHSLAVKTNGTLWSWGTGPSLIPILQPTLVNSENDWDKVAGGYYCSFSIKNNGTLWAWGLNNYGQIGNGTFEDVIIPTQIGNLNTWKTVLPLIFNTVGITNSGTLFVWGNDVLGEVSNPPNSLTDIPNPTPIAMNGNWGQIDAGYYHVLALKNDQTLWSWGQNNYCELGDGGISSYRELPFQIVCPTLEVEDITTTADFIIYPNPATNYLTIKSNNDHEIERVVVLDINGNLIFEQKELLINVQKLAIGLYLIKVVYENKIEVNKFLKL